MNRTRVRHLEESITIKASAISIYDLVPDVSRTGDWSPVRSQCWWKDDDAGRVGAWFTGCNELPHRTWKTRSRFVAAERGPGFVRVVGGNRVRWGYTLTSAGTGTILTESRDFLPGGIALIEERYGDDAPARISDRIQQALDGIPKTSAAIKRIVEFGTSGEHDRFKRDEDGSSGPGSMPNDGRFMSSDGGPGSPQVPE